MKRTIRLNESDLRHLIAESVKKTLNELDWKTYMNAGKKRLAQRGEKSANGYDSLHQAERAFNKEYGSNVVYRSNGGDGTDGKEFFDYPEKQGLTRTYGDIEGQFNHPLDIRMQAKTDVSTPNVSTYGKYRTLTYDPKYKYADESMVWTNDHSPSSREDNFFGGHGIDKNKEPILAQMIKQNHDKAKRELDAYEDGDYEYIKGKGWQLKESINRKIDRIVSESIRRNIR